VRTTDGGNTWSLQISGTTNAIVAMHFVNDTLGFAAATGAILLRTTNGGGDLDYVVPEPFDALIGDATLVDGALIAVGRYGDVYRAALECPAAPQVPVAFQSGQTLWTAWRPQIQWYLNGAPLPNATWPSITTTESGSYTVVVIDALGCTSAPSVPVQIISTAVEERGADAFTVFPNPTNGMLTLSFANDGLHTVLLCDAQGRALRSERVNESRGTMELEELPAGLYMLHEVGSAHWVRVMRE
jgi:hypothetical protein